MIGIVTVSNPDGSMLEEMRRLLEGAGLPVVGIDGMHVLAHFSEEGELIGMLGLEDFGGDCLMRSLAVVPERRGEGIGTALVTHLLAISAGMERKIYLYTKNAQSFMVRFGFEVIPVERVPDIIRSSPLIAGHCTADASAMLLAVP